MLLKLLPLEEKKEEFVLKPCRIFHVIAVNKHGKFAKILHYRNQDIFNSLFDDVSDIQEIIDDEQDEPAFQLNQDTIFELVEPGTFVEIQSPPNAIEPFFIVEVFHRGVSQENLFDSNGHSIVSGEHYAEVGYLQKKNEKKRIVRYTHPKRQQSIYIHIAKIFVTNIALNEDLCMDIDINPFSMLLSKQFSKRKIGLISK